MCQSTFKYTGYRKKAKKIKTSLLVYLTRTNLCSDFRSKLKPFVLVPSNNSEICCVPYLGKNIFFFIKYNYVPLFIFKVNTVYIQYTDIQYHIFPAFLIIRFGTLFHSGPATVVATSVGNIAAAVCSSSCCCFCCGCWLAASQVAFICK